MPHNTRGSDSDILRAADHDDNCSLLRPDATEYQLSGMAHDCNHNGL